MEKVKVRIKGEFRGMPCDEEILEVEVSDKNDKLEIEKVALKAAGLSSIIYCDVIKE